MICIMIKSDLEILESAFSKTFTCQCLNDTSPLLREKLNLSVCVYTFLFRLMLYCIIFTGLTVPSFYHPVTVPIHKIIPFIRPVIYVIRKLWDFKLFLCLVKLYSKPIYCCRSEITSYVSK